MSHSKVLIIGAGAAGIAAASRLAANNFFNFVILEAESRIGGRVFTSEFENGIVEVGAQWVHGEDKNVVHTLGAKAGLLEDNYYDLTKAQCVLSNGTILNEDFTWKLYCLCLETLHDEQMLSNFKGSLGDYFNQSLRKRLKSNSIEVDPTLLNIFLEWFERFQNSIDGSDSWFETSACGTLQYQECGGNLLTRWKTGGYVNIFDLLMGNSNKKIKQKIMLKKAVKQISWNSRPLEVVCEDGQTFTADHILLTVSLGVLKENVNKMFVPSLPPKKLKAIQGLGIGTVDKIFLKFPNRWWPADSSGFSLLGKGEEILNKLEGESLGWEQSVFGFYSVDGRPDVLCGWLVGVAARRMEACTDSQVLQGCHRLLTAFLGQRFNIPAPTSVLRSLWGSNPHFRGSYSFRSIHSDKLAVSAADLAEPLSLLSGHMGLLFAGEATHDHFYSAVHGAVESGWREADRLLTLCNEQRLPKASL